MKANNKFKNLDIAFWANVRAISETIGYTERNTGKIFKYSLTDIKKAIEKIKLKRNIYFNDQEPTKLTTQMLEYSNYRADVLNNQVCANLLNKDSAKRLFDRLKKKYNPNCPIPMNKQKGVKKAPAFFTAMINILIESVIRNHDVDYEPKELIKIFKNKTLIQTLSRRMDGAYPSARSPIAIWEIKEYYNTTTFGSRVADGVYETLLDGFELEEALKSKKIKIFHYLFVDDYFTWWVKGKSYLCRIIDMLHMGKIDEAIFGKEILEAIPRLAPKWMRYKKQSPKIGF